MKHAIKQEIEFVKSQKQKGKYLSTSTLWEKIREKRFTVKDMGVNYRWISHWDANGLLIGNHDERKWRKFSLVEYVWLKMIIKMRGFNLSLETIRSVKDVLNFDLTGNDFMNTKGNSIMDIIPQVAPKSLELEAQNLLKEEVVQEKISQISLKVIEMFVLDILTLYSYQSILINPDGKIIPIKHSYLEMYSDNMEFKDLISKSYVSISITEILRDFIIERDIDLSNKNRLAILNEDEAIVLKTIRQNNLKSVIVRFDKENKMNLLEEVKEEKVDKAERLAEYIMAKGYQDITIKTQDGNIVYCENKKKIMFQKKE